MSRSAYPRNTLCWGSRRRQWGRTYCLSTIQELERAPGLEIWNRGRMGRSLLPFFSSWPCLLSRLVTRRSLFPMPSTGNPTNKLEEDFYNNQQRVPFELTWNAQSGLVLKTLISLMILPVPMELTFIWLLVTLAPRVYLEWTTSSAKSSRKSTLSTTLSTPGSDYSREQDTPMLPPTAVIQCLDTRLSWNNT